MKTKKMFFALALISVVSFACTKEGPVGPAGEDGKDGVANVIYSNWTNFTLSNWSAATVFYGKSLRTYPISCENVTQVILDSGMVMVYVKFGGLTTPMPLPLTCPIVKSSLQHLNYRLSLSTINLVFFDLEDNTDPGTFGISNSYRYIIIPGGVQAVLNKSQA